MSNKIPVINRGDTYNFTITLGKTHIPTNEDIVYFGLMDPHQPFENALVKKRYTITDFNTGVINIEITPNDTLDLYPGIYYYAVKLHHISTALGIDKVITIVNKTKFVIND